MEKGRITISSEVSFSGIGLHCGTQNTIICKPAKSGTGIKFISKSGQNAINLETKFVVSTQRGTCLKNNGFEVHTVEHLLSAMAGLEIDDCIIEIDGNEIPILDGSSQPFVTGLLESGLQKQAGKSQVLLIQKESVYRDEETGAEYKLFPADTINLDCKIIYDDPIIGEQSASMNGLKTYQDEIAPARTFVLGSELEKLLQFDLIKGGRPNNALVFRDSAMTEEKIIELRDKLKINNGIAANGKLINNQELRFDNEPARHKLLDLLGDLYLTGKKFKGKIIASKPGHTSNLKLARHIESLSVNSQNQKLSGMIDPNAKPVYNSVEIQELLPHRYPFLLVDKIIEVTDDTVIGIKNVTINEPFFQGHFPGNPVFPGVLQMEALAQVGGVLALSKQDGGDWDTYFMKMNDVKFKQMVVPGDVLLLKMKLLMPIRQGIVKMKGEAYVGDKLVSEGELVAKIVKREE